MASNKVEQERPRTAEHWSQRRKVRPTPTQCACIEMLKAKGPMTLDELADALGKSREAVKFAIFRVREHSPGHVVHVASWQRTKGRFAAVYAFGKGPDAPQPTPREQDRDYINAQNRIVRAANRAAKKRVLEAITDRSGAIGSMAMALAGLSQASRSTRTGCGPGTISDAEVQ